jgi:hypothetical protein
MTADLVQEAISMMSAAQRLDARPSGVAAALTPLADQMKVASHGRSGRRVLGLGLDEHDAAVDRQRLEFDREILACPCAARQRRSWSIWRIVRCRGFSRCRR